MVRESVESRPVPLARGFAARLALAMSVLIALVCVTESSILSRRDLASVRSYLDTRGRATSESLAKSAAPLLPRADFPALQRLAEQARARDGLTYVSFFDASGLLVAAVGTRPTAAPPRPPEAGGERVAVDASSWEFRAAVPGAVGPAGTVAVGIPLDPLEAIRRHTLTAASVIAVLFMLGAIAAATALARAIARPLQALATAADSIAHGDLAARVAVTRTDEMGALGRSFNAMAESLARSRSALEQKVVELEEANRLKSEFVATISHELRTPLNVIIGYAEMLDDAPLDEEQTRMLDGIRRYSRMQLDLITNVLDFSRLSSGRVSFQIERFSIDALLGEVVAPHTDAAVPIRVHVEPGVDDLVTDRIKLREVVGNLVENAVKFTERGEVKITAVPGGTAGWLAIEVSDTGPGIGPDDLESIFEPFHQLGSSRTRNTGGVGLGLSIVKQLVEALGGNVAARSRAGEGATFRVDVPCSLPAVRGDEALPSAVTALDDVTRNTATIRDPARRPHASRAASESGTHAGRRARRRQAP